jgi:hypothetical protein
MLRCPLTTLVWQEPDSKKVPQLTSDTRGFSAEAIQKALIAAPPEKISSFGKFTILEVTQAIELYCMRTATSTGEYRSLFGNILRDIEGPFKRLIHPGWVMAQRTLKASQAQSQPTQPGSAPFQEETDKQPPVDSVTAASIPAADMHTDMHADMIDVSSDSAGEAEEEEAGAALITDSDLLALTADPAGPAQTALPTEPSSPAAAAQAPAVSPHTAGVDETASAAAGPDQVALATAFVESPAQEQSKDTSHATTAAPAGPATTLAPPPAATVEVTGPVASARGHRSLCAASLLDHPAKRAASSPPPQWPTNEAKQTKEVRASKESHSAKKRMDAGEEPTPAKKARSAKPTQGKAPTLGSISKLVVATLMSRRSGPLLEREHFKFVAKQISEAVLMGMACHADLPLEDVVEQSVSDYLLDAQRK